MSDQALILMHSENAYEPAAMAGQRHWVHSRL